MPVNAEIKATVVTENYGADLDGGRGEHRRFLEDVKLSIFDLRKNDITLNLMTKHKNIYLELKKDAEKQYLGE